MPWWRMFDAFKQAAAHAKTDGLYLMPRQARRASFQAHRAESDGFAWKGNPYPWLTPAWLTR